ncbi:MAG: hypothetical protein COV73_04940 [Candidatus Omnitrophica bacterium CG11_big_fil_rev_8_21_14_0_20_43_6]|nr:MAG: hypothetical protein COV73_04940 [Candidatus Omnitrophica bacterium CG11_big_fil_rev_8_21_14_0_20_43_6]
MLYKYLPYPVFKALFGDRRNSGQRQEGDGNICGQWQDAYMDFNLYYKKNCGDRVNHAGYEIMRLVDLTDKRVLEIGPGEVGHIGLWSGRPCQYEIMDVDRNLLDKAAKKLKEKSVPFSASLLTRDNQEAFPFAEGVFDMIVSFYAFEHIHGLDTYLEKLVKLLKNGGKIVGAIPCEGGIGWGLGRYFTTRRWLKKNTSIDPDRLICWEHPNFAGNILKVLDKFMTRSYIKYWPLRLPSVDLNLVVSFIYTKDNPV